MNVLVTHLTKASILCPQLSSIKYAMNFVGIYFTELTVRWLNATLKDPFS